MDRPGRPNNESLNNHKQNADLPAYGEKGIITMKKAYYYGAAVSEEGIKYGKVDYKAFASAFPHILNNEIVANVDDIEPIMGDPAHHEDSKGNVYKWDEWEDRQIELDKLRANCLAELDKYEKLAEQTMDPTERRCFEAKINALTKTIEDCTEDIFALDEEHPNEVFQWYIVPAQALDHLNDADEIVWYSPTLNLYIWGVTHYGTAWEYVLTDIPCKVREEA